MRSKPSVLAQSVSKTSPQDYPLGIYKLKVVVTDGVFGKIIEDSVDIEKIK